MYVIFSDHNMSNQPALIATAETIAAAKACIEYEVGETIADNDLVQEGPTYWRYYCDDAYSSWFFVEAVKHWR